jgi:hypothetical protein
MAVRIVQTAASPAPCTIPEKPKKKLIAGAMTARVEATIRLNDSALRRSLIFSSAALPGTVSLTGMMCPFAKVALYGSGPPGT